MQKRIFFPRRTLKVKLNVHFQGEKKSTNRLEKNFRPSSRISKSLIKNVICNPDVGEFFTHLALSLIFLSFHQDFSDLSRLLLP